SGAAKRGCAGLASGAAHWPQNLFSGALLAPHDGQTEASGAAHWPQNFVPGGFSAWHRGHFMPEPPSSRASEGRNGGPRVTAGSRMVKDTAASCGESASLLRRSGLG